MDNIPQIREIVEEFINKHILEPDDKDSLLKLKQTLVNHITHLENAREAKSRIFNHTSDEYLQHEFNEGVIKKKLTEAREELFRFMQGIKNPESSPISVMCAIISMNACEAKSLQDSFDPINSCTETKISPHQLFQSLRIHDIHDISNFYREDREEWIPYHHAFHFESENSPIPAVETGKSICDIITNLVKRFNEESDQLIEINFVTDKFFQQPYQFWEDIREQGGIIIVDAVSLLHKDIRRVLLNSSVIGHERIAILAISPINPCVLQPNRILERLISEKLEGMHLQFQKPFDRQCEIARGDFRSINTWFYTILHEKTKSKATSVGKSRMRNEANLPPKRDFRLSRVWGKEQ
jgi:hypothetical protein